MPVITNIEDLRQMAKKRVAKAVFEYVDRGSYDEATLRANRADLEALKFRQRVGIDVDQRVAASSDHQRRRIGTVGIASGLGLGDRPEGGPAPADGRRAGAEGGHKDVAELLRQHGGHE